MNLLPGWLVTAITSRRATHRRREQDLADMGTAFGLDASMSDEFDRPTPQPRPASSSMSSKDQPRRQD